MISVIVCTYNREKYIYGALKSVAENEFLYDKYEILLINNNSTDNTEQFCLDFQRDFPLVNFRYFIEDKQGLSHARNRGIDEARGDFLVFLDDDSFVNNEYLKNLSNNLYNNTDCLAFGGKIDPQFEDNVVPKWLCKWTYSWVSAINKGDKVILFSGAEFPIGANMGFYKKCVETCGNFNIALGRTKKNSIGGEEKDLFNRFKENNFKIYYFPDVYVQHVIPHNRTTNEFLKKMGIGVGQSERLRTLNISRWKFVKRLFSELIKWAATIVLFFKYLLLFAPQKGIKLIQFRRNVTCGLLISK